MGRGPSIAIAPASGGALKSRRTASAGGRARDRTPLPIRQEAEPIMKSLHWLIAAAVAVSLSPLAAGRAAARSEEETVRLSNEVLREFLELRVKQIPASLLSEAHGVAIIPNVIKVGLVVGGQHGKGVIVAREPDGSWRAPVVISFTGGRLGWQVRAQGT